jgi:hypothetical protein
MIQLSILLGVVGLFATAVVMPYLGKWVPHWGPRQYWLVGLASLFPAWLIAFLSLLPSSVGPERSPLPRSALLCSVTALFGVIFTEMAVRQLDKRGYSFCSFIFWLLGVAGLVPAWVLALWILL